MEIKTLLPLFSSSKNWHLMKNFMSLIYSMLSLMRDMSLFHLSLHLPKPVKLVFIKSYKMEYLGPSGSLTLNNFDM